MTLKKAHELADGGIITEAGNSEQFHTGDWREERPVFIPDNCINCLFCWIYCPDNAIVVNEEKKVVGFDAKHCKACGICAQVCPKNCISMEPGGEMENDRQD